jgi:hypothetical protein
MKAKPSGVGALAALLFLLKKKRLEGDRPGAMLSLSGWWLD